MELSTKYKQDYFFNRKAINIDIGFRCALQCPRCQRQYLDKIPGKDISMEEIETLANHFNRFVFCGQLSDPVHHPKFIEIIKYLGSRNREVDIHNASSTKPEKWYIEAFKANPDAQWTFGIDGLPHTSHQYRINQDGEKLFNIMIKSKDYLKTTPYWQVIKFSYNKDDIDDCKELAWKNELGFILIDSSRWEDEWDYLKPDTKMTETRGLV